MKRKLYKLRTEAHLTQEQVGQAVGLSKKGYNLIENGHRDPSWKVAQRLEHLFGRPVSELLQESEN